MGVKWHRRQCNHWRGCVLMGSVFGFSAVVHIVVSIGGTHLAASCWGEDRLFIQQGSVFVHLGGRDDFADSDNLVGRNVGALWDRDDTPGASALVPACLACAAACSPRLAAPSGQSCKREEPECGRRHECGRHSEPEGPSCRGVRYRNMSTSCHGIRCPEGLCTAQYQIDTSRQEQRRD